MDQPNLTQTISEPSAKIPNWLDPERTIAAFHTGTEGPTVVFTGGVHGNEPAGVVALERVADRLRQHPEGLKGQFFAFKGNLQALEDNERFVRQDLNRIWTKENMKVADTRTTLPDGWTGDRKEMFELYQHLKKVVEFGTPPFYFIDLHTVSSASSPFIVINDMLINRELAEKMPVPIILGVEEYVDGTMLNQVNRLGHVAIGFEAGRHDDPMSVDRHESFIWLILHHTDCLSDQGNIRKAFHTGRIKSKFQHRFFELKFRYRVRFEGTFRMLPGYKNFQEIDQDEWLASSQQGKIESPRKGRIFMPLYQSKGKDGFFIIRQVSGFALWLSAFLRKINFEAILTVLPGVRRNPEKPYQLIVNRKVARFLATDIFHLLGYRQHHQKGKFQYFTRREYDRKAKL
jgi:predicted deacylase